MSRVLALDLGEKRIGVAISDLTGLIAQPYQTLAWGGIKKLVHEVKIIIDQQQVDTVVVGIPYTLKGTHSEKTDEVFNIVKKLRNRLAVPVEEEDERLTTVLAEQSLRTMGRRPSKERKIIDQLAAVHILQGWLDRKRNTTGR